MDNFIFIWIPKCAGTSFYRSMKKKYKNFKLDIESHEKMSFGTHGHVKLDYIYSKKELSKFRIIAISRNPYSRALSLYFYLRKLNIHNFDNFYDFCLHISKNKIPDVGKYNRIGLSQCNPQYKWIENIEGVEIFRLEEIDSLFSEFKINMIHTNVSNTEDYRKFFENKNLVNIINSVYEKDFELFGYEKILI